MTGSPLVRKGPIPSKRAPEKSLKVSSQDPLLILRKSLFRGKNQFGSGVWVRKPHTLEIRAAHSYLKKS